MARADESQAQRADGRGRRECAVAELAVEAEVDVQPQVVVAVEEVLAPGVGRPEDAPVEQPRAVLEPALRTVRGHRMAHEQPSVAAREAVDRVSLWHAAIVADETDARAHPSGARLVP